MTDYSTVAESISTVEAKAKKAVGRPKVQRTLDKDRQEFVDNYVDKASYRREPKRMIKALSLPPEEQLQALEDCMQPRQLAFCKEYIIDFHGEAAAIRAGYLPSSAGQSAYNLMKYRGILQLIHLYTQSKAQKITTIDPDYVISKVTEIVSNATKDSDKLRGLELLARHLGMFVERTEITGKDGEAIRYEETRQKSDEVARHLREMGKKTLTVVK